VIEERSARASADWVVPSKRYDVPATPWDFLFSAIPKLGFDAPLAALEDSGAAMTITGLRWVSKPKAASEVFAAKDVRTLIANHLGIDIKRVTDEAHFTDLGADWLDRLDLMILIEERFADVEISDTDIDQIDVVGDLICHIETLRNGTRTQAISDVPLHRRAVPPPGCCRRPS
jgi:acyl carrier protein